MTERKAEFVEPELVKYDEKLADITAQTVGSGDASPDDSEPS
jgi:hypothetical protein